MRISCLLLLALVTGLAHAQTPAPKREFRAVWVASVANLDWPASSSQSPAEQQQDLRDKLDTYKAAGINAVIFQVRPEADALYASPYEPWSRYLTGTQGKAPDPFYDPLTFAVEEAHQRGMELHAWLNPYRAITAIGGYPVDTMHVTVKHPEWILSFPSGSAGIEILNPGIPDVRSYVFDIVEDIITRYDVDGIHFDDYFYPYSGMGAQDIDTYNMYGRAMFTSIAEWRRYNVNMLVRGVWERIQAVRPSVKFGISPFGIWKSGVPSGIVGMSAYDQIYADAVAWMGKEWLDYLTPQLYWKIGGGQDFERLSSWWMEQVGDRHLYAGHGLYKSDYRTFSGTQYDAAEVPRQVRHLRDIGAQGSVYFRGLNFTVNSKGFADSLRNDLYRYPAFPPVMPWKEVVAPLAPVNFEASGSGSSVTLTWEAPPPAFDGETAFRYALYRFDAAPTLPDDLEDPAHIVDVFDGTQTSYVDTPPAGGGTSYQYVLTALDRNWNESAPSTVAVATDIERALPVAGAFTLDHATPNPFSLHTEVQFTVRDAAEVSVRVYDTLGREVAVLLDHAWRPSGTHHVTWSPETLSNGTYVVVLEADGRSVSRLVSRLR